MKSIPIQFIFGGCLVVSVEKGERVNFGSDNEMHRAYMLVLRMLSPDFLKTSKGDDFDMDAYHRQFGSFQISRVLQIYDTYLGLKNKFEQDYGIFSRDQIMKIQAYNKAYKQSALVVSASFPRQHARSSYGFQLTDAQIHERSVMLNRWMGELLKLFPRFPLAAQLDICEFFSLPLVDKLSPGMDDKRTEFILKVWNGEYTLPRLSTKAHLSSDAGVSSPNQKKARSTATTTVALTALKALKREQGNALPVQIQENLILLEEKLSKHHLPELISSSQVSTVITIARTNSAIALSCAESDITDLKKERKLHHFLGVKISKGMLLPKRNSFKLHIGYETSIRVLPSHEIPFSLIDPNTHDIDLYDTTSSGLKHTILKVFQQYRAFHHRLASYGVFSYDPHQHHPGQGIVVIPAEFPPTYTLSSWGIPLTDLEINLRTIQLHHWMCTLLNKFPEFSVMVQTMILDFLEMKDWTEKQSKVIHQMLKREFQYPLLPTTNGSSPMSTMILEKHNSISKILTIGKGAGSSNQNHLENSYEQQQRSIAVSTNQDMENTDHLEADCRCIVT